MSGFVDADAHVVESEATWSFMDAAEARFRPRPVPGIDEASGRATEYWASDGLRVRATRFPSTAYAEGTRDMGNLPARLEHMDRLGVEIQVLLPSFFLRA